MLKRPFTLYINWASYDELSDNVPLTEALAMQQFRELLRLRKRGVRLDGYMMDAFWYAEDGGYRRWRTPHWPQGPDRWLDACRQAHVKPGLWLSGNTLCKLKPAPAWRDSLDPNGGGMCLFEGGFLTDLLDVLRMWYSRGVRAFKFDFLNFTAATRSARDTLLPSEIRARNSDALRSGLRRLRRECPDVILLGYNGFEEVSTQSGTDQPFSRSVDTRWLDVYDSLYCGDPRPSDVPAMNFWRSKDVYSDHMVRAYERNGFPLSRIDNAGFMIGVTGTCYGRRTAAWKGMLILSLARGGWMNTYYGNLELLRDADARWFAKVQSLYLPLQARGTIATFGGIPGEGKAYGYSAADTRGTVWSVVNPGQGEVTLRLPGMTRGRVLFHDAGYCPVLADGHITLGAEQTAVVGAGRYGLPGWDLGVQEDVRIPTTIRPMAARFKTLGPRALTATVMPADRGCLRIVVRQKGQDGRAKRSSGGAPPDGISLGRLLRVEARQQGKRLPLVINYDKAIWSGLSWAVAELPAGNAVRGKPVTIRCVTKEPADVTLAAELYRADYSRARVHGTSRA